MYNKLPSDIPLTSLEFVSFYKLDWEKYGNGNVEDIPDSLKLLCVFFCNCFPPSVPAGPVVNDGGLSWLRKNYQRMKEQAEREQRSLNDVVAERYGVRTDGTLAALTHSHAQLAHTVL